MLGYLACTVHYPNMPLYLLVKHLILLHETCRPDVKIQNNKKLGCRRVVPHASLPDGNVAFSMLLCIMLLNKNG